LHCVKWIKASLCLLAASVGGVPFAAHAGTMDTPSLKALGTVVVWGADEFGASGNAPVVADWIIDTGTGLSAATSGDHDLIASDVHTVITGSLLPTTDGLGNAVGAPHRIVQPLGSGTINTDSSGNGSVGVEDSFSAFRLRSITDVTTANALEVDTSFYVASNVPYAIDVQAAPLAGTSLVQFALMRVTMTTTQTGNDGLAFGASAQYSHLGGANGGRNLNNTSLLTLITPVRAYTGTRRTARIPGTIAEQSIRFNLTYRYNAGTYDLSDGIFDAGASVVYTVWVP
jgi:hypothetical protein